MTDSFDVIVVGGGPGGAAAGFHLARRGRKVLVLDKARFPREKVCGDGLTPRAVKCLQAMDIKTEGPEWARVDGLRIIGGGARLELPWPLLSTWPDYGLVRTRFDFDHVLLRRAAEAGAQVREGTEVTGAVVDGGVVTGVKVRYDGETGEVRAPVVIAADGSASRFGLSLGGRRIEQRPMGVAVRTYYRSPRSADNYLESYLELWQGSDLLPGYGWIFPLPDGTVNVGLGLLNTSSHFQNVNYRRLLASWLSTLPPDWGLVPENQEGRVLSGSLPMGFNRTPVARPGLLLVGDAAGVVNPFNGEGIAYAMESAEIAVDVAEEALRAGDPLLLREYPERLREAYEGYYILGRAFVKMIGNGRIMRLLTTYGVPRERLMRVVFKVLANLTDPRAGDASDRMIEAMRRAAPVINRVARV